MEYEANGEESIVRRVRKGKKETRRELRRVAQEGRREDGVLCIDPTCGGRGGGRGAGERE